MRAALIGLRLLALAGVVVRVPYLLVPRDDEPRDPDAVVALRSAGFKCTELGIERSRRHEAEFVQSSAINFGERRGLECGEDVRSIHPKPETTRSEAMTTCE